MLSNQSLIANYDVALFDLDGVLYLGPIAVPGTPQSMTSLVAEGTRCIYVTNNAARSAETVVAHLNELGFPATFNDVVTSAQAAIGMLQQYLPPGSKVLVAGTDNLVKHVEMAEMVPVFTADANPAAVIQGYDPQMTWPRLDQVALAIQNGAKWFATNNDSTRPTELGLVPGLGAAIAAVGMTVPGLQPLMAGKPFRPLLELALTRSAAQRPIFVGDRLDTDIEGAVMMGMDSLMVFTGAHGKRDLVGAAVDSRPTYIGWNVDALRQPARVANVTSAGTACGEQLAQVVNGSVELMTEPHGLEAQLDALWAITQLVWGGAVMADSLLDELDLLP